MDIHGTSTIKKFMIISFVISLLTLTMLIYVTVTIKARPTSQSYLNIMSILEFSAKETDERINLNRVDINLTGARNYKRLHERPSMLNNGVMMSTECHMTVVVRGYFLYFKDSQPKNRNTWCPNHSCNISLIYSSKLTDILNANVTFFSHLTRLPAVRYLLYLVANRRPDQRYVLMSYETPLRVARNTTLPASLARGFHHWLATYDPLSDIPFTYGRFSMFPLNMSVPTHPNYFKLKSKMVAFVSSNCMYSKWPRLNFVLELQKYIPIDIYGLCGNLTCDFQGNCTQILKQYKFILALENSPCPGYISEKFWNAIWEFESVAIAWGADLRDYERFTPPESFVYLEYFRSIESLAGFIKDTGENEILYNKYHDWRTKYRVEMPEDLVKEPSDEHLCLTADRYIAEKQQLLRENRKIRHRNTNGRDWIQSCRIAVHTKMQGFPIPVR